MLRSLSVDSALASWAATFIDDASAESPPEPTTLTATGGCSAGSVADETDSSLPQAASIKIAHTDNGIRPDQG